MIKKTLNIVLALTLVIAGITVVNIDTAAATPDMSYKWGVTYDGSKFSSTFNASDAILKDVMPGDTIEYVVTYENLHNKNKDSNFYLNTSVIKSLEDTSSASGVLPSTSFPALSSTGTRVASVFVTVVEAIMLRCFLTTIL